MGKKRKNEGSKNNRNKQKQNDNDNDTTSSDYNSNYNSSIYFNNEEISLLHWLIVNKVSVIGCVLIGAFIPIILVTDFRQLQMDVFHNGFVGNSMIGFGSGSDGDYFHHFVPRQLDSLQDFCFMMGLGGVYTYLFQKREVDPYDIHAPNRYIKVNGRWIRDDPSHPLTFAILRESVTRERGGYVHPDLGLLVPAPSGAARGLGMVRDTYNTCQTRCTPGIAVEKLQVSEHGVNTTSPPFWNTPFENLNSLEKVIHVLNKQESVAPIYKQEEVLLKIPLSIQMTRNLALNTLIPLIPIDVMLRIPLQELDDAALLVLLLAYERGRGVESVFHPYISSLPLNPSCGFSPLLRKEALDTISLMSVQYNMDVNGWPGELSKATDRAAMIAEGLSQDYGQYLDLPKGVSSFATMQWALCHVASRATAGSEKFGALRLVPILDMINHYVEAAGFEELSGMERLIAGNFVDADENDQGAFIVRSIVNGRRRPLRKGQELLVNYNVPNYSPLDWFVSLGFVPPERSGQWVKVENVLPKMRTYSSKN